MLESSVWKKIGWRTVLYKVRAWRVCTDKKKRLNARTWTKYLPEESAVFFG